MKKIFLSGALGLALAMTTLNAQTPIEAAASTPEITQQVFSDYLSGYNTHNIVSHLRNTQAMLKGSVHDAELRNLLDYLDVCLKDLDQSVTKPATEANARHVDELLRAITEGNRYITDTLTRGQVVASR
jgi:hypothetical protein